MKKIGFIAGIISMLSFTLNCDDILSDVSYVAFTIPAGISKLHVAVFENTTDYENLIEKGTYRPAEKIILPIPSGKDRVFLVLLENDSGFVYRVNKSEPLDLKAGTKLTVNIDISSAVPDINIIGSGPEYLTGWTKIDGADQYAVRLQDSPYTVMYEGDMNEWVGADFTNYDIRADYTYLNAKTDWFSYYYC